MSSSSYSSALPFSSPELTVALSAVLRASLATTQIFKTIPSSLTKSDKSPVTLGDFAAQAIVNTLIAKYFPDDGIVAEEEASALREDEQLRGKVGELVKLALEKDEQSLTGTKESELPSGGQKWSAEDWEQSDRFLSALDRGNFNGGPSGRFWALDPIDGTKGFLRGGQYAICLALVENGEPILACMACPNLPYAVSDEKPKEGDRSGVRGDGSVFIAVKGKGAFHRSIAPPSAAFEPIKMNSLSGGLSSASFCESVEAGHSSQGTNARIAELLSISSPPVRMDSQAKYASVARGDGDIYLRLPVGDGSYVEKIWDHAAGALLCEEAGGSVSDCSGKRLDFGKGRTLSANKGVVVALKDRHAEVVEAVKKALIEEGRGNLLGDQK
jgi:3'(2'), 5'-bisphosphate nucleotidase